MTTGIKQLVTQITKHRHFPIIIIWIFVTLFNITKPMHFDDAFFIEVAQGILKNPLHPMAQSLYWGGSDYPIYKSYHPLFLPAIFAVIIRLFGESEVFFHLALSVFSLIAIVFFYMTAKRITKDYALHLTAMFAISPAFLPSQNIMSDIPLLSFWVAFFWAIATLEKTNAKKHAIIASICISFAILLKYSSLLLIPMLCIAIIVKQQIKLLWVVLIPTLTVLLWSTFNYFDFGGFHMLGSNVSSMIGASTPEFIHRGILWTIALGSIAPYTVLVLPTVIKKPLGLVFLSFIVFVSLQVAKPFYQLPGRPPMTFWLILFFFANGIFLFGMSMWQGIYLLIKRKLTFTYAFIFAWFISVNFFLACFTPFVAVRHVLATTPALILILFSIIKDERSKGFWIYAGLILTASLGIILGISDYAGANVYRKYAKTLMEKALSIQKAQNVSATVWFNGYLDFQWYASHVGMKQYDLKKTKFQNGDIIIMPQIMLHEHLAAFEAKKIDNIVVPSSSVTLFRLQSDWPYSLSGYYGFFFEFQLPWSISQDPLEEFVIYQIQKPV